MSNGNAKKYFRVFDENYNKGHYSGDTIKRVIDKLYRNVAQNANNPSSHKQTTYVSPTPEKTIPSKEESLDDVVKQVKGISSKSSSKDLGSGSNSYPQPNPSGFSQNAKANPIKYAVGEIVGAFRESVVRDSLNPSYFPVVRDLAIRLLGKPTGWSDEVFKEILAIGGHILLDSCLRKK